MKKELKKINQIRPKTLDKAFDFNSFTSHYQPGLNRLGCACCKSFVLTRKDPQDFLCPICGGKTVNPEANLAKAFKPEGIIPMRITEQTASKTFKSDFSRSFWLPSDVKHIIRNGHLRGLYLPAIYYKIKTRSIWKAKSNFQVDTPPDIELDKLTKELDTTGYFEMQVEGINLTSSGLGRRKITQLEHLYYERTPFRVEFADKLEYLSKQIVPFEEEYIDQFDCEEFSKNLEQVIFQMDEEIDKQLAKEIKDAVVGDSHEALFIETEKEVAEMKYILFPVWLTHYAFKVDFATPSKDIKEEQKQKDCSKRKFYLITDGILGKWIYQDKFISSRKIFWFFFVVVLLSVLLVGFVKFLEFRGM